MISKTNSAFVILCLLLFLLIPTTQAHAYIDAGSASLVVQLVVAGLLGLLVAVRVFKNTILSVLGVKRAAKDDEDEYNPESDDF